MNLSDLTDWLLSRYMDVELVFLIEMFVIHIFA